MVGLGGEAVDLEPQPEEEPPELEEPPKFVVIKREHTLSWHIFNGYLLFNYIFTLFLSN